MNPRDFSLREYHERLRNKELSAEEGVQVFFDAIKKEDKKIHAFLSLREDEALREAKSIDQKIAKDEYLAPLAGIPVALKDNLLVLGEKTTAASKILEDYEAGYDATVVKNMKAAGAVILGKTNLDEFAMGASTENSAYGPTKNPHALEHVPGGSSGGSAAAVAAQFAPVALGSDTGGSIRQPAAFCGVVGFKPSYGAVSRFGLIAMASSLDQIGPLAKSVEDASLLFDVLEGDDSFDATSVGVPPFHPGITSVKKMKLGIPEEYFSEGVSREVKTEVEKVIKKFEADGFIIQPVHLPHTKYALSTYYIIVPAEVSANLARFDAVRYPKNFKGFTQGIFTNLQEKYALARGYGFGDETKRRILLGTFVLSAGHYDEYYTKAERVREVMRREFDAVFSEVDALIAPTTPTPAFRFGEKTDDPLEMYAADALTIPANLAGLPALSLPVKKYTVGSGELPVGFQIIGKPFEDRMVLALGDYFEKNLRG
jgi:aspartyl-tRNA(Asn)/glutamyl-tRNA(Gln) amidotransferase subunit A